MQGLEDSRHLPHVRHRTFDRFSKVGRLQDPERTAYATQRADLARTLAAIVLGGWA